MSSTCAPTTRWRGRRRRCGRVRVAYHHFNYFPAVDEGATLAESADWDFESHDVGTATTDDAANSFLMMLALRPDSVLAALRVIANARWRRALARCWPRPHGADGGAVPHLEVPDDLIARDYELTADVMDTVIERQWSDPTYADQVGTAPCSTSGRGPPDAAAARLPARRPRRCAAPAALARLDGPDQAAPEAHLLGR